MVGPARLAEVNPEFVLAGVIDIIRTGTGNASSVKWVEVCSHSGFCVEACDYGVDPRLMVTLARLARRRHEGKECQSQGSTNFQ